MITISDTSVALIELNGPIGIIDIKIAIDELLATPGHIDSMNELWDLQKASVKSMTASDLQILADYVKSYLPKLGKRTAIVVSEELDYGIARMWAVYAGERAPQDRQIFRNREAALEWLLRQ